MPDTTEEGLANMRATLLLWDYCERPSAPHLEETGETILVNPKRNWETEQHITKKLLKIRITCLHCGDENDITETVIDDLNNSFCLCPHDGCRSIYYQDWDPFG